MLILQSKKNNFTIYTHIKTCNAILEFPLLVFFMVNILDLSLFFIHQDTKTPPEICIHILLFLHIRTQALDLPLNQILSIQSPGLTTIIKTFLKKKYEVNECQSPCSGTNSCKGKLKMQHFKLPKTHTVNPKAGLSYNIAELETESQSRALSTEEREPGAPCLYAG